MRNYFGHRLSRELEINIFHSSNFPPPHCFSFSMKGNAYHLNLDMLFSLMFT